MVVTAGYILWTLQRVFAGHNDAYRGTPDISAFVGGAVFCAALGGAGWAVGRSYTRVHHDFRYVEVALVAGVLLLAVYVLVRRRRA